MSDTDMRELLEQELLHDKLYEYIQIKKLTDVLFSPSLMDILNVGMSYLATDFEKLYCDESNTKEFLCKQGTMRQYIKEMSEYLDISYVGRTITFNYLGFVRLKMALLLRKDGMKPNVIFAASKTKTITDNVIDNKEGSHPVPEADAKQQLRNQFIDLLINKSFEKGLLKRENNQFILSDELFDSNKLLGFESDDPERKQVLLEMQSAYQELRQSETLAEMEEYIDRMIVIKEKIEVEDVELEDYIIRAKEYVERKQEIEVEKEIVRISDSVTDFRSLDSIETARKSFEELESKFSIFKDKITLAKNTWEQKIKDLISKSETSEIENRIVNELSDISQGKYSKKDGLAKIAELEEMINKMPRVNVGVKMAIISTKKDLEAGFFKRLFG